MTRTCFRIFTITDYEAEEQWIRRMFLKGWKLVNVRYQCIYTFEKTEPADMAVRLEYSGVPLSARPDYGVMMKDYGWECLCEGAGWDYFARPGDPEPADNELFTDDVSRLKMIRRIFNKRYTALFLLLVFLIIPVIIVSGLEGGMNAALTAWTAMAVIYVFALIYCGIGFRRLLKKYDLKMDISGSGHGLIVCAAVAAADIIILIASYAAGGPFRDFWSSAMPWILIGTGMLALMIYMTGGDIDGK